MNKSQNRTYRPENLSLSPLNLVLTNARNDVPPRTSHKDVNEELASKLIEKMNLQFQKRKRPVHWVGSHGTTETAE